MGIHKWLSKKKNAAKVKIAVGILGLVILNRGKVSGGYYYGSMALSLYWIIKGIIDLKK